jgi:hypothetical protein
MFFDPRKSVSVILFIERNQSNVEISWDQNHYLKNCFSSFVRRLEKFRATTTTTTTTKTTTTTASTTTNKQ